MARLGQKRVPTTDGFKGRNLYRFDRHTPEERPAIGFGRQRKYEIAPET